LKVEKVNLKKNGGVAEVTLNLPWLWWGGQKWKKPNTYT